MIIDRWIHALMLGYRVGRPKCTIVIINSTAIVYMKSMLLIFPLSPDLVIQTSKINKPLHGPVSPASFQIAHAIVFIEGVVVWTHVVP